MAAGGRSSVAAQVIRIAIRAEHVGVRFPVGVAGGEHPLRLGRTHHEPRMDVRAGESETLVFGECFRCRSIPHAGIVSPSAKSRKLCRNGLKPRCGCADFQCMKPESSLPDAPAVIPLKPRRGRDRRFGRVVFLPPLLVNPRTIFDPAPFRTLPAPGWLPSLPSKNA